VITVVPRNGRLSDDFFRVLRRNRLEDLRPELNVRIPNHVGRIAAVSSASLLAGNLSVIESRGIWLDPSEFHYLLCNREEHDTRRLGTGRRGGDSTLFGVHSDF